MGVNHKIHYTQCSKNKDVPFKDKFLGQFDLKKSLLHFFLY